MDVQYLNGLLFKIKLYETSGNSFQKLFSDIMALKNPGFRRVQAYGSKGDGGNDGYIPSESRYYQVYGPEYSGDSNNIVAYAKKKLTGDFEKICNNWGKPLCYHFVYNDHFKGDIKTWIDVLSDLEERYDLAEASLITTSDLMNYFLGLSDESKSLIINTFPFCDISSAIEIDSKAISQLIRNISRRYNPIALLGEDSNAPDFDKKIEMNHLSGVIRDALRHFSHFVNLAEDFLKEQPGIAQTVAFEMQKLYSDSKKEFGVDIEGFSDLRFIWIAEKLLTEEVKSLMADNSGVQVQRSAALVIMAKYFESCDIYEHPDRIISS